MCRLPPCSAAQREGHRSPPGQQGGSRELTQAHKRRYTRFVQFAEAEKEREGDRVLLLDPRVLVDLLEDERRKEEKAAEAKVGRVLTQRKETPRPTAESHVPRAERRKQRRALRNEKRAALQEAYAKRVAEDAPTTVPRPAKRQK